jgi:hypothetical protein
MTLEIVSLAPLAIPELLELQLITKRKIINGRIVEAVLFTFHTDVTSTNQNTRLNKFLTQDNFAFHSSTLNVHLGSAQNF